MWHLNLLEPVHKVEFHGHTHTYFAGEGMKQQPSITGILTASGLFNFDNHTIEGRERGSECHGGFEQIVKKQILWHLINPDIAGYLQAFEKYMRQNMAGATIIACETPLYSPVFRYCGTPDMLSYMPGASGLMGAVDEFKTGAEDKKYERLQTGGQIQLARENYPQVNFLARRAVHLQQDGNYKITPLSRHTFDFQDFLVAKRFKELKDER